MASGVCAGITKFCRNLKFQQDVSRKPYKKLLSYYSIYVSRFEEFWRGHLQSVVELKWNDPVISLTSGLAL